MANVNWDCTSSGSQRVHTPQSVLVKVEKVKSKITAKAPIPSSDGTSDLTLIGKAEASLQLENYFLL